MRNVFTGFPAILFLFFILAGCLFGSAARAQSGAVIGQPEKAPAMLISRTADAAERNAGQSVDQQRQTAGSSDGESKRKRRAARQDDCRTGAAEPSRDGRRRSAKACSQEKGERG